MEDFLRKIIDNLLCHAASQRLCGTLFMRGKREVDKLQCSGPTINPAVQFAHFFQAQPAALRQKLIGLAKIKAQINATENDGAARQFESRAG